MPVIFSPHNNKMLLCILYRLQHDAKKSNRSNSETQSRILLLIFTLTRRPIHLWHTRWRSWRSRRCPPQRQHIWMTWSRQLFQFVLCGHPMPRCWSSQKRELSSRVGLFRSRLRTLGTHYHPTLDPAVLWTPSNDTSRPICSDSLNLTPPAPLYLRTLWRYTNAVIIIIIIIIITFQLVS